MASLCISKANQISKDLVILNCIRCQYIQSRCISSSKRQLAKSHYVARSFKERLDEIKSEADKNTVRNNIGFPLATFSPISEGQWLKDRIKYETAARHKTLEIDLEEVGEKWKEENGSRHSQRVAEHYGIFQDLYDSSYFHPKIFMDIEYDVDKEFVMPINLGNKVTPTEAEFAPNVDYRCGPDTLWTLIMCSPDGNLHSNDKECLHWMIGNIPGNKVDQGEVICDYMPPFPPKGTGFLRYIFVLYEQNQRMDYSRIQRPLKCMSLTERSFSTLDFYGEHQDNITPAALSFFQSQWDPFVQQFLRQTLGKEPEFEFIKPPSYHPVQRKYPNKQPFNLYMDRYRDIRDVQEEVLKEKLKSVSPLTPPASSPRFPLATLNPYKPSWQKLRDKHIVLKRHQWKDA